MKPSALAARAAASTWALEGLSDDDDDAVACHP
jgi:hypothetical protein